MTIKSKLSLLSIIPIAGIILGIVTIFSLVKHTNRVIDTTKNQDAREIELARRMQFDVVQVQQFLTDFSVTRGQDGLDDGIQEAEKYRDDFNKCIQEFKALAGTGGETEDVKALESLQDPFQQYYVVGQKMAEIYAKDGTAAGNKFMPNFDKAADNLTQQLEPFVKVQEEQFYAGMQGVQTANNS